MLRSRLLARMVVVRDQVDSALSAAQNRYKYDKRLRKTSAFKINEVVFVDAPPLAVGKNSSKRTDQPTYNNLLSLTHRQYCITSAQHHTLTMDENGGLTSISIDGGTPAHPNNRIASKGKERNDIKVEDPTVNNEYQVPEGEVAESDWGSTDNRQTHPTRAPNKIIDAYKLRKSKDPDVNNGNEKQRPPERVETKGQRSGNPVTPSNIVNRDDVGTRE